MLPKMLLLGILLLSFSVADGDVRNRFGENHKDNDTNYSQGELQTINEPIEPDSSFQYIPIVRQTSCENISETEMATILAHYPNVRVRCEAEDTILSPKIMPNMGRYSFADLYLLGGGNENFTFIESGSKLQLQELHIRYPMSPCLRPSDLGSGQIEVTITLNTLVKRMKEISGNVPIIEMQAGRAQYFTEGKEFIYSATCVYENQAVRPAVELLTLITSFQTREWIIAPTKQFKIERGEWKSSRVAELSESSLVISCLSEMFVPDICLWTEADALKEIVKYFQDNYDKS